jgi:quercetin dioxygenase-like cupin family protein
MKIVAAEQVASQPVAMEGASGCRVRWLVGEQDQAPNFAMRHFEVEPGGYTPRHFHPYEHEVYVLDGEGVLIDGDVPRPLRAGDVAYIAPDEVHQFRNVGDRPLKFLCLIPHAASRMSVTTAPECGREPQGS